MAIDLSDDETFRGGFPHDHFRWLRAEHPLFWHEPTARTPDGEGFWVVSRYADVKDVQKRAQEFSSDRGGVRDGGGTALKDERSAGTMLNQTDDPDHQRLRALVNRGFTPRAIRRLEDELRHRAARLLDASEGGPFDFVHGFARELPAQAIFIVLGMPEGDRERLLDVLDAGIEADSPSIISEPAMREIHRYGRELVEAKRARPDDAILSSIVHARSEEDGTTLSDRELAAFFVLLFPAGSETTRSALAGGLKAFIDHPDQYARLRDDPGLVPTAIEELVRWTTPSIYKRRTASVDAEVAGGVVRRGDKVTFWEMSANRDEAVWPDPFTFDVGRQPNPHLGFGWGTHFCLGAHLARLEVKIALELLIERYSGFEQVGPAAWMPNNRLLGYKTLPVRLIRG